MGNPSPSPEQLDLLRLLHAAGGVAQPTHFRLATIRVVLAKGWAEPCGGSGLRLTERGRRLVLPA